MKDAPKVYLARAGRHGDDEDYALEHNLAVIGFLEVPSLAGAQDYDAMVQLVQDALPDGKPRALGNFARQLWAFADAMQEGDLVVLPRKITSQIAIGLVTGPYRYAEVNTAWRHTRPVEWVRPDIPRATFEQDLLYSFGAFMTVCNISRNDAARRVAAVLEGKPDPGQSVPTKAPVPTEIDTPEAPDLTQLVDAVLQADGWETKISPPGADGGVDILAGRGSLGLDAPRLCVQVKSQNSPSDVTVYRTLQGTMQTFKAEQGLLVCWGGVNKVVLAESRQGHFMVRLWDSRDLVRAIYRTYERLPAEIQAELPLTRVWMLVAEESSE